MTCIVVGTENAIGAAIAERLAEGGDRVVRLRLRGRQLSTGSLFNPARLPMRLLSRDSAKTGAAVFFCGIHEARLVCEADVIGALTIASSGLASALEAAEVLKSKFILLSGAEVYGDTTDSEAPQAEDFRGSVEPGGETHWFGQALRFAEALTLAMHRKNGLDVSIIRAFPSYGNYQATGHRELIPALVRYILFGDRPCPSCTLVPRSFCHLSDLAEGVVRARNCSYSSPINIGSPTPIVPGQILAEILEIVGDGRRVAELADAFPVSNLLPDISLARKVLGWYPRVSLRDGLTSLIGFLRERGQGTEC